MWHDEQIKFLSELRKAKAITPDFENLVQFSQKAIDRRFTLCYNNDNSPKRADMKGVRKLWVY